MIPREDRELLGLGVVAQVRVVAGAVDVVEVRDELLEREVVGEAVDVEPLRELSGEGRIVGVVEEVEELDQRREVLVVGVGLLVEDLVVGRRIRTAVAPVPGALGLVQDAVGVEGLVVPSSFGLSTTRRSALGSMRSP